MQAKNEVKVLNSLNHPNIVKYYECYQERNMMHIIMEFCQVTLPLLVSRKHNAPVCLVTVDIAADQTVTHCAPLGSQPRLLTYLQTAMSTGCSNVDCKHLLIGTELFVHCIFSCSA